MTGEGVITGGNNKGNGGGVVVEESAFNMTGGTIIGNAATVGGVYVSDGTFSLSGKPTVTGNTGGNVYLPDGRTIAVTGALSDGAKIGVTMEIPGAFTEGLKGKGKAASFTINTIQNSMSPQVWGAYLENIDALVLGEITAEQFCQALAAAAE